MPSRVHADPQLTLVFLGGSTTECYWVDEESRFPALAGKLLGDRIGKRVNSLNAGVSGANTLHMLYVLLSKVIPLRPDVVVLMENVNDVNMMLFTGSYWSDHRTRSVIEEEEAGAGSSCWAVRSGRPSSPASRSGWRRARSSSRAPTSSPAGETSSGCATRSTRGITRPTW